MIRETRHSRIGKPAPTDSPAGCVTPSMPGQSAKRRRIANLVAVIGLAATLSLAGASVLAQSNPHLDCQPRQGIDYC
jgi:hypothetical protein